MSMPNGTDEFVKGLWKENPVFVQVLGMCPALAVSNTARNALAMGLATLFVLLMLLSFPTCIRTSPRPGRAPWRPSQARPAADM